MGEAQSCVSVETRSERLGGSVRSEEANVEAKADENGESVESSKRHVGKQHSQVLRSMISALKPVDLATVDEPGVIVYVMTSLLDKEEMPGAFVWFPEPRNELLKVSNHPVSIDCDYMFIAAANGMLCGLHYHNIFNYGVSDHPDRIANAWKLRFVVFDLATASRLYLPPLKPLESETDCYPGQAFEFGSLQVSVDSDGSVHVLLVCSCSRSFVVYTHEQGSLGWKRGPPSEEDVEHPRGRDERLVGDFAVRLRNLYAYDTKTRRWSSVSGPGEHWNDYPMPPELGSKGYKYRLLHPVIYCSRLIMTGVCHSSGEERSHAVILEQRNVGAWEIVAWTECFNSRSDLFHRRPTSYAHKLPRLCGKLLVFPSGHFTAPTAFHLEKGTWVELPPAVIDMPLQLVGTFEPRPFNSLSL